MPMPKAEILPTILSINSNRCNPPLDESEVEKIVRSIAQYPPGDSTRKEGSEGAPEWSFEAQVKKGANCDEDKPYHGARKAIEIIHLIKADEHQEREQSIQAKGQM